jgi:glycerophosphoryl diester phosphodiesterase
MAHGCNGFEFDVRFTRDSHSVLHHDASMGSMEVAACNYEDLRQRRQGIACLEEVLAEFGAGAYLDIELKVASNLELVLGALHEHPPLRGYVISSFLPEVLQRIHEIDRALPLGYICDNPQTARRWAELPVQVFIPHHSLVSAAVVEELHARGLQLFTWTVNRRDNLLRLADWGVDGLISDDPELLRLTFS